MGLHRKANKCTLWHDLGTVRQELAAWAAAFDPTLVPANDCTSIVNEAAAIKNIAAIVEALAASRVSEAGLWRGSGAKTAAEWLAKNTGTTANQAKEAIATGQRLGDLEATSAAARQGKLSPQQAASISDAATANPDAEAELLGAAEKESLGELRDRCKRMKAEADPNPEATHKRIHDERCARSYADGEGAWNFHARTTPEAGAEFCSVLDDITDQIFNTAHGEGRRESRDAYAADALLEMARRARDGRAEPTNRRRHQRFLAIIRADFEALLRGAVADGECARSPGSDPSRSPCVATCWVTRSSNWCSPEASTSTR